MPNLDSLSFLTQLLESAQATNFFFVVQRSDPELEDSVT